MVLAAPAEARIVSEAPRYGVATTPLPIARKKPRGLFALRSLLARERFDLINTHSSTDSWLAALACATTAGAPPIVRTRHISAAAGRNAATRWLYGSATARIVTTGEQLRRQVVAETGVDAARVVSIPTGIDLEKFRPGDHAAARASLGLPANDPVIGIVATLRDWKGHHDLLRAVARLSPSSGVRRGDESPSALGAGRGEGLPLLVIVGDGPQRNSLERLVAELNIDERVRFAGEQVDVVPWLNAFDVFCLPSYANEGVPQALMQAMACGLAVVTTPVGSIAEIVTDGVTGVFVPPREPEALARALAALLGDADRRAALGARAAAIARERFGEERMLDRMLEVFHAVARPA
jgi:glycosyltransferase involved in cell wall biosynthesis